MKTNRTLFTWILALGMLIAAYLCINGFMQSSLTEAVVFLIVFLIFGVLTIGVWIVPLQLEQEKSFFQKKCQAISYAAKHQNGSKKAFCLENGEDMYEYCLNIGLINEELCASNDDKCWEASLLAFVIRHNLKKDGFLKANC